MTVKIDFRKQKKGEKNKEKHENQKIQENRKKKKKEKKIKENRIRDELKELLHGIQRHDE